MLKVTTPSHCQSEIGYVLKLVLSDWLGLEYEWQTNIETDGFEITMEGSDCRLCLPDVFFNRVSSSWLEPGELPFGSCQLSDIYTHRAFLRDMYQDVPVVFGENIPSTIEADWTRGSLDIFGSIFFLVSRYEEAIDADTDQHGRFRYRRSWTHHYDAVTVPVADVYTEVLWAHLSAAWPGLSRRKCAFSKNITCDVDVPYSRYTKSPSRLMKKAVGDLVKRRSVRSLGQTLLNGIMSPLKIDAFDPCNTFQWIMRENELSGNAVSFFFIADNVGHPMNGGYLLDEPAVMGKMQQIAERGHNLGIHGGYQTFRDADALKAQTQYFRDSLKRFNIDVPHIVNRQHYLRWNAKYTPDVVQNAGIEFDSTLGFAETGGFRCGTCREFPMYDLLNRRPLRVCQRPLIVMEESVIAADYMNLGLTDGAADFMLGLKNTCRGLNGVFTLLWHNNSLSDSKARELYRQLIR